MSRARRVAQIVLALASVALVAGVVVVDLRRASPGPLARPHAELPELAGPAGCSACHGALGNTLASGCNGCHAEIGSDLELERGLHGTLAPVTREACGTCHLEHHGAEVALVDPTSFARAGVPDLLAYDHAALGFTLGGRHAELACDACHAPAPPGASGAAAGVADFRGLSQACDACHDDPHRGTMRDRCDACHAQDRPFGEVATYAHRGFDDGGAHGGASCVRCHEAGSVHALARLVGGAAEAPPPTRACVDCHADPHASGFSAAAAAHAVVAGPGDACARCHDPRQAFADAGALEPALHATTGFPLEAPHAGLACAACHGPAGGGTFAERYPGRRPERCEACHADPHGGEFAGGPFADAGCSSCHLARAFTPAAFDVADHGRTRFALEGSHAAVECERCHARAAGAAARFDGLSRRCNACHADAHRGRLADGPDSAFAQQCVRCHEPTTFDDVDRAAFDHGRWTAFALDGAHARVECDACHAPVARADEHGRRFGFAPRGEDGGTAACDACHADPHDGAFDRPGQPAELEGRAGCARCHDARSFTPAPDALARFDHALWTGYPLEGAHVALACTACHDPERAAPGHSLGPAAGAECADCHGDPHAGQFAADERGGCARCHAQTGALVFRHGDSRFPLDARHAALACDACHQPWPLPGGGRTVRYRPLGTTCVECHGPLPGQARRGGGR